MKLLMKRIFVFICLAIACVGFAAPAHALSIGDLQTQIQELLARVAALTAQMNQMTSPDVTVLTNTHATSAAYPHRICALLNRNLSHGMSGDDVRGVQEFLQREGFFTVSPTGYFGPMTGQAIEKWQAREGLSPVGAFGPLSRERLRLWCGGGAVNHERFSASPVQGSAPLTVVFDTWLSGYRMASTYFTIDFGDGTSERAADCYAPADACLAAGQNKHTYTSNGVYTAVLSKVIDSCAGNQMCTAAVQVTPIAKQQITVGAVACTKEYAPVCASKQVYCITTPCNPVQETYSNRCTALADGAQILYEGQCRTDWQNPVDDPQCKSWYDGCNSCSRETSTSPAMCTLRACFVQEKPYCTGYFGNTSSNKPPTISRFSGPTTLGINETGTWSIEASDPENEQLSYSVRWGDEAQVYPVAALSAYRSFSQNTSFTHGYARSGTYTVTIIVQDSRGQSAETRSTVVVRDSIVCSQEYAPVCGRPTGCANTCPVGMYCAMLCQLNAPVTYSNRCYMSAAGADLIHVGACTATSGTY